MALNREKIETNHLDGKIASKRKQWMKNQFNRYIRRIPIDVVVNSISKQYKIVKSNLND